MAEERVIRLRWPARNDGRHGPSEQQERFLRSGAREQLYGGSKRGGKTLAGCAKAIYLSILFPGNRGMIARQAFTDLRDSTLVTFFNLCPPELILDHNRTEHRIVLRSCGKQPSEIIYRGLGEQSDLSSKSKEKVKSIELGWLWVDEPSEVSYDAYAMLRAQLCWSLPDGSRPPYMSFLTSNPEPGWVKERFIDELVAGAEFIPSLPRDNPGLPPGWETDLRQTMDEDWVKRYLDGSWEIHEGMVFTELTDRVHNLDNYVPADAWDEFWKGFKLLGSLDHASTGITAYVLTGIDHDENAFALEEHYQRDWLISDHAASIKSLESRYAAPEYRLIDPSTESKTLQSRGEMFSVQDAYIREGVPTIAAHRAQIGVGLDLVKQYLHVNPLHRSPFTQAKGSPRLFISKSRCPNLWREMQGLKRVIKADGTYDYVGADHAVDNLRYILMSRPTAPERRDLDIVKLPTPDQFALRAHDRWAQRFGQSPNSNSWF